MAPAAVGLAATTTAAPGALAAAVWTLVAVPRSSSVAPTRSARLVGPAARPLAVVRPVHPAPLNAAASPLAPRAGPVGPARRGAQCHACLCVVELVHHIPLLNTT